MKLNSKPISINELLQRIGAQPQGNVWLAILAPVSDFDKIIEDLQEAIEIFAECEVGVISANSTILELINQIQEASQDYLLLRNFESWTPESWREFDFLRSRIDQNKRGGVLILSSESTKAMFSYAPNFTSWLGARVFILSLGEELLTDEEIEDRLSALREWSGLSDSQVIKMATFHQLPLDPEYGEWLILLNRGDLIER